MNVIKNQMLQVSINCCYFEVQKKLEILVTDMVIFCPQKNVLKNSNLNDYFTRKSIKHWRKIKYEKYIFTRLSS